MPDCTQANDRDTELRDVLVRDARARADRVISWLSGISTLQRQEPSRAPSFGDAENRIAVEFLRSQSALIGLLATEILHSDKTAAEAILHLRILVTDAGEDLLCGRIPK